MLTNRVRREVGYVSWQTTRMYFPKQKNRTLDIRLLLSFHPSDLSHFEVTSGSRKECVKIDLKRELGKEGVFKEETIVKDIELKEKMNSKEVDEEVDLRQRVAIES